MFYLTTLSVAQNIIIVSNDRVSNEQSIYEGYRRKW
jgi:hypothetical protein